MNFPNITETLRLSVISTRCHGTGPKFSENLGPKTSNNVCIRRKGATSTFLYPKSLSTKFSEI